MISKNDSFRRISRWSFSCLVRGGGAVAMALVMSASRLSAAGCTGIGLSTSVVETEPVEPGGHFSETRQLRFTGYSHTPNSCLGSVGETGTISDFTGPEGGEYVIDSGSTSSFGELRGAGCDFFLGVCFSTVSGSLDYELSVGAPAGRPAQHWDASFTETVTGTDPIVAHWTIHIGESFTDMPRSATFYKKVETLLHYGLTTGCSPTEYCPGQIVPTSQLATILARKLAGGGARVPASGMVNGATYDCTAGGVSLFSDVAPTDAVCKHVNYLAAQNVTIGCAANELCPSAGTTRGQIAKSLALAIVAPGGEAAVPERSPGLYNCSAANPRIHFTDVPVTDPLCKYVHYLWASGMIAGCSPTTYCPGGGVTRDQMAKFVVDGFGLKLP